MSYSPQEPTPVDVIRRMAGDTSNDSATEILADDTYAAILGRFGVGIAPGTDMTTAAFHRAAAEALRSVAVAIERDPTSISAPSDGSIGWTNRTQSLRDQAKALDAKADALDAAAADSFWGPVITVRSDFLTNARNGRGESW